MGLMQIGDLKDIGLFVVGHKHPEMDLDALMRSCLSLLFGDDQRRYIVLLQDQDEPQYSTLFCYGRDHRLDDMISNPTDITQLTKIFQRDPIVSLVVQVDGTDLLVMVSQGFRHPYYSGFRRGMYPIKYVLPVFD